MYIILNNETPKETEMDPAPLQSAGMRATFPRLKILEVFHRHPARHLGAAEVYRELLAHGHDVGLATVYRVLGQLVRADLLVRHHFDAANSVFELAGKGRHDHVICTRCGKVAESADPAVAQLAERIARRQGYSLVSYSLSLYGCCDRCARPPAPMKGVYE